MKSTTRCFGILPMAGKGSRIQPIAFSKELYPIIYRQQHFAISEFSVRGMLRAKVDEIKLVVNPDKMDIAKYYAHYPAPLSVYFHASKSQPESCFFPTIAMQDEDICLFGLPDTLFSPNDGYLKIRHELETTNADICLGLFEVPDGNKFDSVLLDGKRVAEIRAKNNPPALSNWIWGIWGARVKSLRLLKRVINRQKTGRGEKILGLGFNAIAQQHLAKVIGLKLGHNYFDVGTMESAVQVANVIDHFEF
jgi:glucose-1-phosphate thymidylyltransferase